MIQGTSLTIPFSRVVDGDTVRVFLPGATNDESLRILSLDTEESFAGGGKPVTPLGKKAKERAEEFFNGAQQITIEFPGNEDLATCLQKYRGNYGRLLVYVYRDNIDYQETMIEEGFSPYFCKYGYADFADHHCRYLVAERTAQYQRLGVWNQILNNGSELRNYAALGTWWDLRARLIEKYRQLNAVDPSILNTRLDYERLNNLSQRGEKATIFTELRTITRVGGSSGLVRIGSEHQPFSLFIPDIETKTGQEIVNFLESRYISSGESHPRRSYAYLTGVLSRYQDKPQMLLESAEQISDGIWKRDDSNQTNIAIQSALPNPPGADRGFEKVTLINRGPSVVSLDGWKLKDLAGFELFISGQIALNDTKTIALASGELPLNNNGDDIFLIDDLGKIQHHVSYQKADAASGKVVLF